ncbi:MAG: succinate--CoA ligase subunit beta [Oscillatoriaceae bacterium SKW80]|nr:succinate--CoA ligase subunit beta [Oscillatoriaceae bacterium SKYG93]MCX8122312.1 succinate--CoA ligase subunit beta [Oscillatoriaceae bacterium SKW80]MDW8452527.1 succinate--CoA ligase subunit beta [Oscillatoriaceae cyanobacterium SKYGB_i_bin93]HIK29627.1 succinate--CoA ligase subunit beta [Oscillatoriaceae cyanobacterium M7585_C2015_266]
MDLLEYQAKELFRQMGIPVLPSQRIDHPSDLKGLKIPYPIVLKSQVRVGGRGKAGGVRFVENTIDAVAAAQTIFHLPIMGEYPQVLLAEAKYASQQEFYLAVVLDRTIRKPVLLGSIRGGIDAEATLEHIQQVVVDSEFSPFYARRLTVKMGLKDKLIQSVSAIIEAMFKLFSEKDLDLVEINPLGISAKGEVMALDGKVIVNDEALGRHPELAELASKMSNTLPPYMNFVQLDDGNIALACNGMGLTMATLDLVRFAQGKVANFLNLGGELCHDVTPATICERIEKGLELITRDKKVNVVLVNFLCSTISCNLAASAIEHFFKQREESLQQRQLHFVARLVGREFDLAKEHLSALRIPLFQDLEQAVNRAVELAKKA